MMFVCPVSRRCSHSTPMDLHTKPLSVSRQPANKNKHLLESRLLLWCERPLLAAKHIGPSFTVPFVPVS